MGMDACGTIDIHTNWTLWASMMKILEENGFDGELPQSNDGTMVNPAVAREAGRAVLKWWKTKAEKRLPREPMEFWETTILAYALLLVVDEGQVEHL